MAHSSRLCDELDIAQIANAPPDDRTRSVPQRLKRLREKLCPACESFVKTLKQEEIYANDYRDLEHLRESIEEFIERYYNRSRLHPALADRTPGERQPMLGQSSPAAAKMSLFRHGEVFLSDGQEDKTRERIQTRAPVHRLDETPSW